MTTEQERRAEHSATMVKRRDALCRHFRPALRVAAGRRPAASVAMTIREPVRRAG